MIDTRFAFITAKDGTEYQVLKYGLVENEDGTIEQVAVDWDEEATRALIQAAGE